jgi:hypothetical protein
MTGGWAEQIAAIRRDLSAEVAAEGDELDAALYEQWFDSEPLDRSEIAYM